jgi:hypothetical protein
MTNLSRRELLIGTAAVAATAMLPAAASAAVEVAPPALAAAVKPRGWWGYSSGGEIWHGFFDSREDALGEAQSMYPEDYVETGFCVPLALHAPDLHEHCVLWIGNQSRKRSIAWDLSEVFYGANEDAEWEGELSEAFCKADYTSIIADMIDCCANALFRAGRPDLIPALFAEPNGTPICDDEDLLTKLDLDKLFEAELDACAVQWINAQNLDDAPRALDVDDNETHEPLPEDA